MHAANEQQAVTGHNNTCHVITTRRRSTQQSAYYSLQVPHLVLVALQPDIGVDALAGLQLKVCPAAVVLLRLHAVQDAKVGARVPASPSMYHLTGRISHPSKVCSVCTRTNHHALQGSSCAMSGMLNNRVGHEPTYH